MSHRRPPAGGSGFDLYWARATVAPVRTRADDLADERGVHQRDGGTYVDDATWNRWQSDVETANEARARARHERRKRDQARRDTVETEQRRLEQRVVDLETRIAKLEFALELTQARLESSDALVDALLAQRDGPHLAVAA